MRHLNYVILILAVFVVDAGAVTTEPAPAVRPDVGRPAHLDSLERLLTGRKIGSTYALNADDRLRVRAIYECWTEGLKFAAGGKLDRATEKFDQLCFIDPHDRQAEMLRDAFSHLSAIRLCQRGTSKQWAWLLQAMQQSDGTTAAEHFLRWVMKECLNAHLAALQNKGRIDDAWRPACDLNLAAPFIIEHHIRYLLWWGEASLTRGDYLGADAAIAVAVARLGRHHAALSMEVRTDLSDRILKTASSLDAAWADLDASREQLIRMRAKGAAMLARINAWVYTLRRGMNVRLRMKVVPVPTFRSRGLLGCGESTYRKCIEVFRHLMRTADKALSRKDFVQAGDAATEARHVIEVNRPLLTPEQYHRYRDFTLTFLDFVESRREATRAQNSTD